jgi:hypothetical protein
MNELLQSLKSDLLDRRMLPILLAVGVLLAGAVAYVVLAGGSSEAGTPSAKVSPNPASVSPGSNLAVTQAPENPHAAVAETTDGARYRHKPGTRDPFTPLPSPKTKSETTSTGTTSSVSSPSPSSTSPSVEKSSPSSTGTGGAETTPSTPVKPPKKKPKTVYLVSAQFGLLPSTTTELAQLTPYSDLKRLQPLPSKDDQRLIFAGPRGDGKGAVFELSREAILKGQATCIPTPSQCEAIDLEVGQSEELTYLEPDGQSVPYELKVVSITTEAPTASASRVHHHHHHHQG